MVRATFSMRSCAGAQAHAADGHFERALASIVQRAKAAKLADGNMGIVKSAGALPGASREHTRGDFRRTRACVASAQFLKGNRGHFDVQIDAVEQRPADFREIPLDDAAGAAAFARGIAVETAGAPVQITNLTDRS